MPHLPDVAHLNYLKFFDMEFAAGHLYHIYNRGNGKNNVFFNNDNYIYFLRKIRKYISPVCDILSYSLMPNHFHFLIHGNEITEKLVSKGGHDRNVLCEAIRNLLSSYTKAINNQQRKCGSLFQQNTKSKCLTLNQFNYSSTCFHYIHQNAWKAGLVTKMEDWQYCSFRDYIGLRKGTMCNKALAFKLLDLDEVRIYNDSYGVINKDRIGFLF